MKKKASEKRFVRQGTIAISLPKAAETGNQRNLYKYMVTQASILQFMKFVFARFCRGVYHKSLLTRIEFVLIIYSILVIWSFSFNRENENFSDTIRQAIGN